MLWLLLSFDQFVVVALYKIYENCGSGINPSLGIQETLKGSVLKYQIVNLKISNLA